MYLNSFGIVDNFLIENSLNSSFGTELLVIWSFSRFLFYDVGWFVRWFGLLDWFREWCPSLLPSALLEFVAFQWQAVGCSSLQGFWTFEFLLSKKLGQTKTLQTEGFVALLVISVFIERLLSFRDALFACWQLRIHFSTFRFCCEAIVHLSQLCFALLQSSASFF